jgi:hypothetical protein
MEWFFETKDRDGVTVRMSKATYEKHLPMHPEIADYVEEAKLTIQEPEIVKRDDDGCHHHYRLGLGRGKYEKCYLRVLVIYHGRGKRKHGVVASYWMSRNIGRQGEVIWLRKS